MIKGVTWAVAALAMGMLLAPRLARADEEAPPAPPAQPPPPVVIFVPMPAPLPPAATVAPGAPAAPATPTGDEGRNEDASHSRTWIMPTAETTPQGAWSFTDYELLLAELTYGITDEIQVSLMTLVPIGDVPTFVIAGAKIMVIKSGRVRAAAMGHLVHYSENSTSSNVGLVGGVASLCLDDGCRSMVSGGVQAGFGADNGANTVPFSFYGSIVLRASRRVKFVAEVDSAGALNNGNTTFADGALVVYGIRFYGDELAGDLGFAKPFCQGCDTNGALPLGFPVASFTFRWR